MKTNVDDRRSCSSSTGDEFIGDCIDKNSNEFMSKQRVGEEIWTEGEVDNAWEFEDSRTLEDAVFSA